MRHTSPRPLRRAFGILQALIVLLLISGMMTVLLKYASIGAKHTADSYVREQADLFLRSATEHALLDISAYDRAGGSCWAGGTYTLSPGHGRLYTVTVTVERYYLKGEHCDNVDDVAIATDESHGYVLLRLDLNATLDGSPAVRMIRRSLQHP